MVKKRSEGVMCKAKRAAQEVVAMKVEERQASSSGSQTGFERHSHLVAAPPEGLLQRRAMRACSSASASNHDSIICTRSNKCSAPRRARRRAAAAAARAAGAQLDFSLLGLLLAPRRICCSIKS